MDITTALLNQRYRLDRELGCGSMGTVYLSYDLLLEREVVVKVLHPAQLDAEGRERLLSEARVVAKLDHPNIIQVYDAGEAEDAPFIVMQAFVGQSLYEVESLPIPQVIEIAIQVCLALGYAHQQDIIHRDVKPENVILMKSGDGWTARLTDFGLARSMASRLTSDGIITGTVFYMAPEQALGKKLDGRADLYALGVMLYERVAGKLPFEANDPLAVISQHLHAPVVPPSTYNEQVSPALEALILQLLSKQVEDRPASADEVRSVMERILDQPELSGKAIPTDMVTTTLLDRITRGRLVGRQAEMVEMTAFWKQATQGEAQVLLVSGEPGVGKSRLVRELVTRVIVAQGQALIGECFAEGGLPYAPFAQCIQDLDLSSLAQTSTLADLMTLAPSLRARYPAVPPNPTVDLKAEQQRLFESVFTLFSMLSERSPLLLVLEDVHWAERGTLALFQYLARRATRQKLRLLCVLTYREIELDEDHMFNDLLLELSRERLANRLKLGRLSREQTREILAVLFAEEITPEFLEGIYRETEGNPFFIEEVCKALIDKGALTRHGGRWHKIPTFEMLIPQSIRLAVQARLRKLPQPAQDVLRVGAVMGRTFEYEPLKEVSELGEDALLEALESAERAQLITQSDHHSRSQATSDISFTFAHALIPSTLEMSLSPIRRQRLHQRVAQALERAYSDKLEEHATRLGRHYLEARELEKAAGYFLTAGDHARQQYAHQEAARHYQQALFLLQEQGLDCLDRAASTSMKLGLLYHTLGDHASSRQSFQQAFSLWQQVRTQPVTHIPPAPHAFRQYWLNVVQTLDPIYSIIEWETHILRHLFYGLIEFTPQRELLPGIAHSWEVLEDGRHFIFHLRDDFAWSDGVPVTAGDFVCTIQRALDRRLYPFITAQWYEIKGARPYHQGEVSDPDSVGIHALDDFTLSIELEEPLGYFIEKLNFFPIPHHVVATYGVDWNTPEHLVTNGPFQLASWEPGKRILLERNPGYRGRFSGNLQQVELTLVDEDEMHNPALYEQDQLDLINLLVHQVHHGIRSRHPGEFVAKEFMGFEGYWFKCFAPPFNDRRVRQAFIHAVDRQALANLICHGNVSPVTGGMFATGTSCHSPGIALGYDPVLARRLLAEAGYPGGKGFPEITVWTDPRCLPISRFIQSQWRDNLGLSTSWTVVHVDVLNSMDWERDPKFPDIILLSLCEFSNDPILSIAEASNPGSRWYDAHQDRLVQAAVRIFDPAERLRYIQAVDRYMTEEAKFLQFYYSWDHILLKPWVKVYPFAHPTFGYWSHVILESHE